MTLAKYRHPQHKLDSIFDDLFGNSFFKPFLDKVEHGNSVPSANIKEEDKSYTIELAVPGMKKDDLKIDLEENILSISAENKSTSEDEYKIREFNYHSFNRSFRVPKEIQGDKDGNSCRRSRTHQEGRRRIRRRAFHRHQGQGTARDFSRLTGRREVLQRRQDVRWFVDRWLEGHQRVGHDPHARLRHRHHRPFREVQAAQHHG